MKLTPEQIKELQDYLDYLKEIHAENGGEEEIIAVLEIILMEVTR